MAEVLAAQKLYSAAIGYWDKALSLDPGNVDAGIARAIALSENGDQDAATSSLQQIVKTHPDLAVAHFNLGTVYANQKSFRQAADEYRDAARLTPADPEARFALAKCLVFLAEYSEAIPILKAYALVIQSLRAALPFGPFLPGTGAIPSGRGATSFRCRH